MKTRILSFIFPLVLAIGIISFSPATTAAAYPEKPVTFFCGFPAGGAMDMTARAITEAAKKYFPKPMAVVNRPGAAGTIGAAEIIQAKPDGYTIGITAVAVLTIQPHRTKLPFGAPEDYTPIIKLNNLPICFAVRKDAPWKNMKEVIEYARANPGKLRVGHPGLGTILHLDLELLKGMAKVDMTAVPFAGGAESVPALLGGHRGPLGPSRRNHRPSESWKSQGPGGLRGEAKSSFPRCANFSGDRIRYHHGCLLHGNRAQGALPGNCGQTP